MSTTIRTAEDFEDALVRALCWQDNDAWEAIEEGVRDAGTFADRGLLTRDRGLVVRMANGAEFQVTVVRSERPDTAGYSCPDCGWETEAEGDFVDHMEEHGWDRQDAVSEMEHFATGRTR